MHRGRRRGGGGRRRRNVYLFVLGLRLVCEFACFGVCVLMCLLEFVVCVCLL